MYGPTKKPRKHENNKGRPTQEVKKRRNNTPVDTERNKALTDTIRKNNRAFHCTECNKTTKTK